MQTLNEGEPNPNRKHIPQPLPSAPQSLPWDRCPFSSLDMSIIVAGMGVEEVMG